MNRHEVALVRWSEWHASIITACVVAVVFGLPLMPAAMIAGASFIGLIGICRGHWTPTGRFGLASWVTAVRLFGVVLLPIFVHYDSMLSAFAAAGLLILDGVDGWLARRLGTVSPFGEYFDKEVDAFFMLMLCVMAYQADRFGAWILIPGILRYAFVWFIKAARPPKSKERGTARGKWIYALTMISLIVAITPFSALYFPAVVLMSGILLGSFVDAAFDLYRPTSLNR